MPGAAVPGRLDNAGQPGYVFVRMPPVAEVETEATLLETVRALPSESQRAVLSYAQFLQHQEDARRAATEADETEYLLRSPANREKLLSAVADVEAGRNLVEPDQAPFR